MYALALDQRSAAAELGLTAGDAVLVAPVGEDGRPAGRAQRPRSSCGRPGSVRPVRPATTLAIALLLAAILVAGVIAVMRI